jgi:hypothetical protein
MGPKVLVGSSQVRRGLHIVNHRRLLLPKLSEFGESARGERRTGALGVAAERFQVVLRISDPPMLSLEALRLCWLRGPGAGSGESMGAG